MIRILAVSTLLALFAASAWAQDADMESRIAELRAMSPDERKATLKSMTPEARRGLWLQAKKMDWEDRNAGTQGASGFYRDAIDGGASTGVNASFSDRAVGTITYDDGTGSTTFGGGAIIGNRFNTATGNPVLASGTVSTVVAVVAQGPSFTTSSAGFVLEGPQTTGGGAFAIFSTFTGATGTTDTVTFNAIGANYTGSSFFVLFGDFANSYVPVFDTGTNNGQGHHGVVGYTGGMGPDITSTFDFGGTLNALIRVTGNVLPVELIEYGVE
jgi:hypothetical protein